MLLSLQETVDGESHLKAIEINSQTLGSLLFARIAAHNVAVYLSNIEVFCVQEIDREVI